MELTTVWFVLIAVLWTGYFVLEGFDFGVGILLPILGRSEVERRTIVKTIGPVWDGNEVWLLVAGGATFAAFPEWYATLFSGFYLPLFLILLALIARGVALEYRSKSDSTRGWDRAFFWGSLGPAFLWGVAFANMVRGVPLDADHEYTGTLLTLLNPFALLGGLATLLLFTLHGAIFLALRTTGELRLGASRTAKSLAPVTILVVMAFLLGAGGGGRPVWWTAVALVALGLIGALAATLRGRDGWAFTASALAVVAVVAALFCGLWPNVLPALDPANSLTVVNAASTPYTLTVMTWVAAIFTPVVLAYQAWTYWVFRRRLTGPSDVPVGPPDVGLSSLTPADGR
ncbi:Cytochrome d ubiquinol oxidase subunit II [[Actinomadura] parvosata subsp. kistnae]|uniref:Cytochrome d ubiquinol oxidase subunit II n=1 Tax=[Actinomadura] parvosata subsp. kistnae TaxID=1909395 RepID=A0A1U9ZYX6_9ACTN|nr:cytochrome d ubiquinol oxidase subunit II [Nonomuraea sp. ATCC 55076]AQZ63152.1 cytochrome d ubiquinol oxidase subunit II [Nonomuraea sp. ATCC 55076]SPL98800.1 Cytochrome d ubiquinol oxidase subunit II [Actinomadura parvosata subsp. kistnae]